jgi:hypothetical protein
MGIAAREKFLREYTLPRHVERMRQVFLDVGGATPNVEAPQPEEELAGAGNVPTTSNGYGIHISAETTAEAARTTR